MKRICIVLLLCLPYIADAASLTVSNDSSVNAFFVFKRGLDELAADAGYVIVRSQTTMVVAMPDDTVGVAVSNDGFTLGGIERVTGTGTCWLPSGFSSSVDTAFYIFPSAPDLPFGLPDGIISHEGMAFFAGLFLMATVRIFRAGLRWFKRAGTESYT